MLAVMTLSAVNFSCHVDLPQVDLMNFRVEFVRPRAKKSREVGFSFSFRAKLRDLQLVSQITSASP